MILRYIECTMVGAQLIAEDRDCRDRTAWGRTLAFVKKHASVCGAFAEAKHV